MPLLYNKISIYFTVILLSTLYYARHCPPWPYTSTWAWTGHEHDNLVSRPINQQTHQSLVSLSSASLPSALNTRQIKSCYDNKPNNTHSRQKFTMSTWLYLDDHRGFYYKGAVYRLLSTANNDGRWCLFKPVRFTQWLLFYCYSCLLWYGTNTLYDDSW